MNRQECDVLLGLMDAPFVNQRNLSERCGHSLGVVNRALKQLRSDGFINVYGQPTLAAIKTVHASSPRNAIILAAGFGMRMVPINTESPKAFLEVKGETLIERLIRQLHEVEIRDITIVVGFMRESFEYLIDQYDVKLAVNREFAVKNNLHSLALVQSRIDNTYIIPSDIWCQENPFRSRELYSWYMVSDALSSESDIRVSRNMELVRANRGEGNAMIGIAYLTGQQAQTVRTRLSAFDADGYFCKVFWEATLYEKKQMCIQAKVASCGTVVEINTYEQLRELDGTSGHLRSDILNTIASAFGVAQEEIRDITVLKKGMTNRSFVFSCRGKKYIMRIPGEGTDRLINRKQEAAVYNVINGYGLCDNIVLLDPQNGYKVTEFIPNARTCDPENRWDVERCMRRLREFHDMRLRVDHKFDIFEQIEFYESLWQGIPSAYRDYAKTKEQVFSLRDYILCNAAPSVLTHIDAVADNFLLASDTDGKEQIWLIDWEYAGMQDPHVDIAMFCIYALYDRCQTDTVIDAYFPEGCPEPMRTKIYCYISACGLLWSNWCEYKRQLGVELGEYAIEQYRYAKSFYRLARQRMEQEDAECTM